MTLSVLHVVSGLDPRSGGTVEAAKGMAMFQAGAAGPGAKPLQVSLVATYREGDDVGVADQLRSKGVDVTTIGPTTGPLSRHPALASEVRRLVSSADVVHIHALWEEIQYQAAVAARSLGRPYVVSPHGMLDPWSLGQSPLKRWKKKLYLAWRLRGALNGAAAMHFTTRQEADLTRPLGLRPSHIVEPLGVDLSEFDPLPPAGTFRSRYPELAGKRVLLFLGRVHPKKGLDLLVPALAHPAVAADDVVLVVAGPDADGYADTLRRRSRELGVERRVLFTGMLRGADRVAALRDADVFVLPSYQENFGISVIESLAAGTPVVISDQVNLHQEVARGGVGQVVRTDVDELARAIGRWLSDPGLRAVAGAAAPGFVRERFDWRNVAEHWVGHYAALSPSGKPS